MNEAQERRAAILRLAVTRGPISHSDVSFVCPFWSRETIRLDLVALVQAGRLRAYGDRKGRRYEAVHVAVVNGYMMG